LHTRNDDIHGAQRNKEESKDEKESATLPRLCRTEKKKERKTWEEQRNIVAFHGAGKEEAFQGSTKCTGRNPTKHDSSRSCKKKK
jgi:hypothetical protein